MKQSKKYAASLALIEKGKAYSLTEAVALVKKTATTKFDGTIDISFNLNIDTKQADQQLRGTIVLPHSNGKTKKILAITNKTEEATAAGADYVGGKEMLQKIQSENWFDFDVIVATPDMMGELGRMGRILGPKGLMPNPKAGTVTMDVTKAVQEIKAGKIEYRLDKTNIIHVPIGKASFTEEQLADNFQTLMDAILKAKPSTVKGAYFKSVALTSTMGPGVKLNVAKLAN